MTAIACLCHVIAGGFVTLMVAIPLGFYLAPHLARYLKGRYGRN